MLALAAVFARVIAEAGSPPPDLVDDKVLLIKRSGIVIGDGCAPMDAGVPDAPDAGDAGPSDAGVADDANDGDAGPIDAGTCTGVPTDAVTLVIKPQVSSAAGVRFAVLFVTPSRPILESIPDPFPNLEIVTAPVITFHEVEVQDPALGKRCDYGAGCNFSYQPPPSPPSWTPPGLGDANLGDGAVVVEPVGQYEIVRAQPADPAQLSTWLSQLGYAYDQADVDAIAPYIARGFTVVAVRISVAAAMDGHLAPIALTWAGSTLSLPAALGAGTVTPTTVYIAAEGRYQIADPTVPFADYTSFGEAAFLTRNDVLLAPSSSPDQDPVAARIPGDPRYISTIVEDEYVHVPVADCSDQQDVGCCPACSTQQRPLRFDLGAIAVAVMMVMRRRRRR